MVLEPAQDFVSSDFALNHAEILPTALKYQFLVVRDCSNFQGGQFVSMFLMILRLVYQYYQSKIDIATV